MNKVYNTLSRLDKNMISGNICCVSALYTCKFNIVIKFCFLSNYCMYICIYMQYCSSLHLQMRFLCFILLSRKLYFSLLGCAVHKGSVGICNKMCFWNFCALFIYSEQYTYWHYEINILFIMFHAGGSSDAVVVTSKSCCLACYGSS